MGQGACRRKECQYIKTSEGRPRMPGCLSKRGQMTSGRGEHGKEDGEQRTKPEGRVCAAARGWPEAIAGSGRIRRPTWRPSVPE